MAESTGLINTRIGNIKRHFTFVNDELTQVTKEELKSKLDALNTNTVFSNYTFHIGEREYNDSKEEDVVWVDPEGLTFGWVHMDYEKDGKMDYKGLAQHFTKLYNDKIDNLGENERLYISQDEGLEQTVVLVLDTTPVEDTDLAVTCEAFVFATSLMEALSYEMA